MSRARNRSDAIGTVWVALIGVSFGLLTAPCFVYVSQRAHRRSWQIASALYSALSTAAILIWLINRDAPSDSPAALTFFTILGVLWLVGFTHAVIINPQWLRIRWRLANGVPMESPSPVRDDSQMQLGAPHWTSSQTSSTGLNLNTASATELAELPGISDELAQNLVRERDTGGSYRNGLQALQRVPVERGTAEGLLARVSVQLPRQSRSVDK